MAKTPTERRGLGRGLSALMADADIAPKVWEAPKDKTARQPDTHLPIEKVRPNPDQPRQDFVIEDLRELAASVREKGIIQPLLVRVDPVSPGSYQIVAGERRWRAAQMANLHEVPVLIREFNDTEVIEVAIIENIQRADLNAVEESLGYRQLMDKFGHTQERLAEALGKSRSHIANSLRLLSLSDEIQGYLREGKLSAGHARALITAEYPAELARRVIEKQLSVRQTEQLAKATGLEQKKSPKTKAVKDADTTALQLDLSANLGMGVSIEHHQGAESGKVTISYKTLDQLDELCGILTANARAESI